VVAYWFLWLPGKLLIIYESSFPRRRHGDMPLLKEEGVLAPLLTRAVNIMGCPTRRAQESADSRKKEVQYKPGRRARSALSPEAQFTCLRPSVVQQLGSVERDSEYMYQIGERDRIIEELVNTCIFPQALFHLNPT